MFTWTVEQYVVILYVTQAFLQPVKVVGEVLHAENQASVGAKSERGVLHHVIHLDEFTDVCGHRNSEVVKSSKETVAVTILNVIAKNKY